MQPIMRESKMEQAFGIGAILQGSQHGVCGLRRDVARVDPIVQRESVAREDNNDSDLKIRTGCLEQHACDTKACATGPAVLASKRASRMTG